MRSSIRRSTPACGEGTHGRSAVRITTRCAKSALVNSCVIVLHLERVQEKWEPVFRPDARQIKSLERDDDSKKSHLALEWLAVRPQIELVGPGGPLLPGKRQI